MAGVSASECSADVDGGCLDVAGVGRLELGGSTEALQGAPATSDAWAVLQALGFGSSFYRSGAC